MGKSLNKSLVCITDEVSSNVIKHDDGWKALKVLEDVGYSVAD